VVPRHRRNDGRNPPGTIVDHHAAPGQPPAPASGTLKPSSGVAGFVAEVTDDKSQKKTVRKRLQVANGPKTSTRAQVTKLADMI
jgi:hypothetical protein